MKSIQLTDPQRKIIRDIANIELQVLNDILEKHELDNDHKYLLEAYGAKEKDYFKNLKGFQTEFLILLESPDTLFSETSRESIALFRHIFFLLWDSLRESKPNASLNLFQHLEVQLNINEIEDKLNNNQL